MDQEEHWETTLATLESRQYAHSATIFEPLYRNVASVRKVIGK